jgi:hypothetical protein
MHDNRDRAASEGRLFFAGTSHIRLFFAYNRSMFDPNAHLPRINKGMIYLGASLIAGIRLARQTQVNVRVGRRRTP